MNTEVLNEIEGERSIPSVNSVSSTRWKRGAAGIMFLCLTAGSAAAVYMNVINKQVDETQQKPQSLPSTSSVPERTFTQLPIQTKIELPPPVPEPIVPIPVIQAAEPLVPPKPPPITIDRSAAGSSVPVSSSNVALNTGLQDNNANLAQRSPSPTGTSLFGGDSSANSQLGQALVATQLQTTSASRLSDRDYLLTRGAFIDCALNTRLDSTLPGMTSCAVTRDVFSSNGRVLLIEAGSTVTGEYRANLAQGSQRIFVLWSRVETPTGVVINLDSPATDSLGASGISGHVDTHFWQRFGGAMLLSLVDDATQIAVNRSNNNENTQILLGSSSDVASELAAEVLRYTINIPPTLNANQGARVGIFVARDVSFNTVYDVR